MRKEDLNADQLLNLIVLIATRIVLSFEKAVIVVQVV